MGQTLSEPVTDKESAYCQNDLYRVSKQPVFLLCLWFMFSANCSFSKICRFLWIFWLITLRNAFHQRLGWTIRLDASSHTAKPSEIFQNKSLLMYLFNSNECLGLEIIVWVCVHKLIASMVKFKLLFDDLFNFFDLCVCLALIINASLPILG